VTEQQVIVFQRSQSNGGGDEEDNDQRKAFNDRCVDVRQTEDIMDPRGVMDRDEVRIMIKVLGAKVRVDKYNTNLVIVFLYLCCVF